MGCIPVGRQTDRRPIIANLSNHVLNFQSQQSICITLKRLDFKDHVFEITSRKRKKKTYNVSLRRPVLEGLCPYRSIPHSCVTRPPLVSSQNEQGEALQPLASAR